MIVGSQAMEESRDRIGEICERNGACEILVAPPRSAMERMWEGRKCLFEAANHVGGIYKSLDVVVPRNHIAALFQKTLYSETIQL